MSQAPSAQSTAIPFKAAFWYWLSLGCISFGGPAGQISLMHQELVEKKRWISEKRFLHALNYTMVLPGPEAQQLATYMSWLMHGTWGGLVAGCLFVLPSLILLIALSWIYIVFGDVALVQGFLYGIKPAVTAIVLLAAYKISAKALHTPLAKLIAIASFLALFAFNVPFPLIILTAALANLIVYQSRLEWLVFSQPAEANVEETMAVINDQAESSAQKIFNWAGFWRVIIVGLSIWMFAMGGLILLNGWQASITQIGWFFSKAAMVTFGGAYAVLPYVYQGAVEHYGWLNGSQMIDGLALGETTPGPLIMVVAFIGFVANALQASGDQSLLMMGISGAVVATFFTFLPSFIFIFAGAPLIEASRKSARLSAPLAGITAAVVGVILNLALFFAFTVFWPEGFAQTFEWPALIIFMLGFLALFRFQVGVIPVIVASGSLGIFVQWLF